MPHVPKAPGKAAPAVAPKPAPSAGRAWVWRLAAATIVPALCFLLLEAGLRVAGYGYPTGFFVPIRGRDALTTNQRFGWRFFPRALARTPTPCVFPRSKPSGGYRVFVLGESAAMGFPEPAFSFGRMLETMLRDEYPGVNFQVINTAMTAINSHAIVPISRDCAGQAPELYVVYMGNNEVVGPYGPGTVFHGYSPHLPLIRANIWLKSTRTGELLEDAASRLARHEPELREWKGMAMFLRNQVAADDPRLERVYAGFRQNLLDICRAARGAGAAVVLCTVATNLKDSAPFASLARRDLSEADRSRWKALYERGVTLEQAGDCAKARGELLAAAQIDDRFAGLQFRLARCSLALGDLAEAKRRFVLARDLDALRFRAGTRINQSIRDIAGRLSSQPVRLADAEVALAEASRDGIAGDEFFYEHVHLKFAGNYVLARAVLRQAETLLPGWVRRRAASAAPPSEQQVGEQLAYTGWDQYRMAANMFETMGQPPFTNQIGHEPRRAQQAERLHAMKQQFASADGLRRARAAYEQAVARAPHDLQFRLRFAELLREADDSAAAAGEWRALLAEAPEIADWRLGLAGALSEAGQLNAAVVEYRGALDLDPGYATAHFGLATALEKQGKLDEAGREYREALRLDPEYAEAHNNLGLVMARLGRTSEAIGYYTEALRLKPDYAAAHNNLGLALDQAGQAPEAARQYAEAVRLDPDFAGARYNLAASLARAGKLRDAEPQFSEALRLEPGSVAAHYGLAGVLAALGDWNGAAAHYRQAVRLQPDFAKAHYDLGVVLARQGKTQ
ncbi:MAG TPA: tetratricopeptide repeat protein, partial [Bryobacterales bacterium]|nr:tetratricopeptide repeat protein [Bryobacterales bacterium]